MIFKIRDKFFDEIATYRDKTTATFVSELKDNKYKVKIEALHAPFITDIIFCDKLHIG